MGIKVSLDIQLQRPPRPSYPASDIEGCTFVFQFHVSTHSCVVHAFQLHIDNILFNK